MSELFSNEELYNISPLAQAANKPVTCLGKTFSNNEERRKYFRGELRKKLPELKKLEGFPIGEDDDIIDLSDPPYYTACPNPWLNDFIAEWENEKTVRLAQGDGNGGCVENFNVTEPYASDVSEGKNNPIYNAHSYHTKVPHPAIMRYILHYTQPGDIVLDGFAGTGMTGVAASMCGHADIDTKNKIADEFKANGYKEPVWGERHAICGDLSPIASFIAYNYNTSVDTAKFETEAKRILDEVEKECGWMYETKHTDGSTGRINYTVWSDVFICPDCGSEIVFWEAAVDKMTNEIAEEFPCPGCGALHTKKQLSRKMVSVFDKALNTTIKQAEQKPVLITYEVGKKKYEKTPDENDLAMIEKINARDIPYWFPNERNIEGKETRRNDHIGITHTHHFYTKRNLYILSKLCERFDNFSGHLLFNSQLINISKMNRYRPGISFPYNPLSGTMYIGSQISEANVFDAYKNKIKKLVQAFNLIQERNVIQNISALNNKIYSESIDYIFTDPPFGANIDYSELNFIWESWLKVRTNNKTEAIENKTQCKGLFEYQELMQKCFAEYFRVLKPGHWMTVEFSNTSANVWNCIQNSIQKAGFVIANVASLDKQQGSFKAVTTPTAVKQDLVISCYKPSAEFEVQFEQQDTLANTWSYIAERLEHLPLPEIKAQKSTAVIERSPKILYDRLITFFLMRNLPVPLDAADFQAGLRFRYKEEDGMIFTATQLAEYQKKKHDHNVSESTNLFALEIIISEADAIQWLKNRLEQKPQKYQDLQPDFRKANATTRKGEEPLELRTILEENFIKNADDTWRCPDLNEAKDREALRTKALLKEFDQYVAQIESTKKSLKTVRLSALQAGFAKCWQDKNFERIVNIAEHIPQDLLGEDETLLNYYDIACDKVR